MLILITDDNIEPVHYRVLQESLMYVDKLHIKMPAVWKLNAYVKRVNQYIYELTENDKSLKGKIVVHLNEQHLSDKNARPIHHLLFEEKLLDSLQQIDTMNFHLSETVSTYFISMLKNADSSFYYKRYEYNISASVHHLNINETYQAFSYVMYGPVFESISKKNYGPSKNLEELKTDLKNIEETTGIPVIGVGGIRADNFADVLKAGFSGLALRGYIWQSASALQTFNHFIQLWKNYKSPSY